MEGNQTSNLKINSVAQSPIGRVKKNVFETFYIIAFKTKSSIALIIIGLAINLVNLISVIFSMSQADNWRFGSFEVIKDTLKYANVETILQLYDVNLNIALLSLVLAHHALFLTFIFYFSQKICRRNRTIFCQYINVYYSFINPGFSVSFYMLFLSQIFCQNTDFNKVCYSGTQFLSLSFAVVSLILHLLINALGVFYFYLSNSAIHVLTNGSSKIYLWIVEIERFCYALFVVTRSDGGSDKQIIIVMLIVCVIKIYEKVVFDPFYDLNLNRAYLVVEGIHVYIVLSVTLVIYSQISASNPLSFITSIVSGILFGIAYQYFIEYRIFNKYEKLRVSYMNEKEMVTMSTIVTVCIINIKNGVKYRKIAQRILFEHKVKHKGVKASSIAFEKTDFINDKDSIVMTHLANYWKCELDDYLRKNINNNVLLMHKIFLSLFFTEEIYSVIHSYRKIESIEKSFLKEFEVFILKYDK
jgi:hypothetical protein